MAKQSVQTVFLEISTKGLDVYRILTPENYQGPTMTLELINQMLVRSSVEWRNHDDAVARAKFHGEGSPWRAPREYVVATPEQAKGILAIANRNYRAWWQDNVFIGPEDHRLNPWQVVEDFLEEQ